MATLTGQSVAASYQDLLKRADTYSQTGTNVELMDDSAVVKPTGLYLESGATTDFVGIGTATPTTLLELASTNPSITIQRNNNATSPTGGIKFTTSDDTLKLNIATNTLVGSDAGCEFNFGTDNKMFLHSGGNLGIGETSPEGTLHVKGSSFPVTVLERTVGSGTTGASSTLRLKTTTTGNMADTFGTEIQFSIEDATATNQPVGAINAVRAGADNTGNLQFISYSTGSQVKNLVLDANSLISLSNNDGAAGDNNSGNTIFGNSVWNNSSNNDSDYNTIMGYGVMGTGAVAGATYNVAIGSHSLTDITSGDNNVSVGSNAGSSITTGYANVIIGKDTADVVTTMANSIAIGKDVMGACPAGQAIDGVTAIGTGALLGSASTTSAIGPCVAIGADALKSLTTGAGNIAMGYEAMGEATISSQTTVVGHQAMADCSDIENTANVFVGYQSGGGDWTTGASTHNVAVGHRAMWGAMNAAQFNVCVGTSSGTAITTGDHNTLVGNNSGDGVTTGAYNTGIGSAVAFDVDANKQICIGYAATTSALECIAIGTEITNSTTRTVKFGDAGNSMISLDWDTGGDSTFVRSSDIRKKRNIKDSDLGLEFINKLRPVTYQWKPQNELPKEWENYSETNRYDLDKVHMGFIAQEVKAVIDEYDAPPEVAGWMQDADGMQRLGESKLITPLIKAVQELTAKVEELENKCNC